MQHAYADECVLGQHMLLAGKVEGRAADAGR